jgi:chromosome segregation ATPase
MKQNRRLVMSLAALLVVCGLSLSNTATAREAESGSNSGSGSSSTGSGSSHGTEVAAQSNETETETEVEHGQETAKSQTLREQFKQEAKTKVETEHKSQAKVKSAEQKQKSCEARKASLTKRMNNSVAAAQRHKENFDKIYARVKTFHDTKSLNVTNYDTLVASVDKAQQDAVDQIAALKALDVAVDCTQTDSLATNISAFQTAVKSTRDSLKTYRKAIVDLITQLHGASSSTTKTGDSGTESSTNSTTN